MFSVLLYGVTSDLLNKEDELQGSIDGINIKFIQVHNSELSIGSGNSNDPAIAIQEEGVLKIPQLIDISEVTYTISEVSPYAFSHTSISKVVFLGKISKIGSGAFENSLVQEIEFMDGNFDEIPSRCFYKCTNLYSILLPSIKIVGDESFTECKIINFDFSKIEYFGANSFAYTIINKAVFASNNLITLKEGAFRGSEITSIDLPLSIRIIEKYCFCESMIQSFVGNDNLTEIGSYAFSDCVRLEFLDLSQCSSMESLSMSLLEGTNVKTIILPNSIKIISNQTFYQCSMLNRINFPSNLEEIGSSAFEGCTSLLEIDLSETACKIIGNNAFKLCSDMISVSFSSNIKSIGSGAFTHSGIIYLMLTKCDSIGVEAFKSCLSLGIVNLEETSIKEIQTGTFSSCTSLSQLFLPKELEKIYDYSFYGCSLITEISFPSTVNYIYKYAFQYCKSLISLNLADTQVNEFYTYSFNGCNGITEIQFPTGPSSIDIDSYSFSETAITRLVMTPNINYIGAGCFARCYSLEYVDVSKCTANKIFSESFLDCKNLTTLIIGSNIKTVGSYAFSNTAISIFSATSISLLQSYAFAYCNKLITLDLGQCSFEYVPMCLCLECVNLIEVKLPNTPNRILTGAFKFCHKLERTNFPKKLTTIQYDSFMECFSLEEADFSNTKLTTIELNAFKKCSNLRSVKWSPVISTIGEGVFDYCYSLTHLKLTKTMTTFAAKAFVRCGVVEVDLSDFGGLIKHALFSDCKNLSKIIWSDQKYQMELNCFKSCGFVKFVFPSNVESIDNGVLRGNTKLKCIDFSQTKFKKLPEYICAGNTLLEEVILPSSLSKNGFGSCCFLSCPAISNVTYLGTKSFEDVASPFNSKLKCVYVTDEYLNNFTNFCGLPIKPLHSDPSEEEISSLFTDDYIESEDSTICKNNDISNPIDTFTSSEEEENTQCKNDNDSIYPDICSPKEEDEVGENTHSKNDYTDSYSSKEEEEENDVDALSKNDDTSSPSNEYPPKEEEEDANYSNSDHLIEILSGSFFGTVMFAVILMYAIWARRKNKSLRRNSDEEKILANSNFDNFSEYDQIVLSTNNTFWNDYIEDQSVKEFEKI